MFKKFIFVIILVTVIFSTFVSTIYAQEQCGATVKVTRNNNNSFHVETEINNTNLVRDRLYKVIAVIPGSDIGGIVVTNNKLVGEFRPLDNPEKNFWLFGFDVPSDVEGYEGTIKVQAEVGDVLTTTQTYCSRTFTFSKNAPPRTKDNTRPEDPGKYNDPFENDPLKNCPNGEQGIDTAIGCIPIGSASQLMGFILRWAVGIGGGIAFLLMLYAGFVIMTSSGNPERLKGGQELLTAAIAGLIMLILSIFILRLIGVNILQIPGFGV